MNKKNFIPNNKKAVKLQTCKFFLFIRFQFFLQFIIISQIELNVIAYKTEKFKLLSLYFKYYSLLLFHHPPPCLNVYMTRVYIAHHAECRIKVISLIDELDNTTSCLLNFKETYFSSYLFLRISSIHFNVFKFSQLPRMKKFIF